MFCLFLALPSQPPVHIPHTTKQAQCMAQFLIATFFNIIIGWDDVVGLACEEPGTWNWSEGCFWVMKEKPWYYSLIKTKLRTILISFMLIPIPSCVLVGSFELCPCLHTLHLECSLFLLFLLFLLHPCFLPMPRKATPHNYLPIWSKQS